MKKIYGALDTIKNISEALEELDNNFRAVSDYGNEYLGKYGGKNGQILPVELEEIRAFLKSTLISLLDKVVMKSNINRNDDEQFKRGWNDCRQELIKKINEIKK